MWTRTRRQRIPATPCEGSGLAAEICLSASLRSQEAGAGRAAGEEGQTAPAGGDAGESRCSALRLLEVVMS